MRPRELRFTMRCPYYHYDEATSVETECDQTLTVRWWPGTPPTWEYPGDPPRWEAWGCEHAEDARIAEHIEWEIGRHIDQERAEARDRGVKCWV